MSKVELFGKEYVLRDFICTSRKFDEIKCKPSVRLYVRISNICNGNCKFCLNHRNSSLEKINKEKLGFVIKYLWDKKALNAITLTGGEPMLNHQELNDIVNYIYSIVPDIRISISTNGTNLKKFLEFDNIDKIEAIHISRHHFDDKINSEILGCDVATLEDIKYVQNNLKNKNVLIINSIMMKGYIEKIEDIQKLGDMVSSVDIRRLHLVSLINYNEFCRERYIEVRNVLNEDKMDYGFFKKASRYRKDFCECHEYEYIPKKSGKITILVRCVKSNNSDYIEQLVFTNENKLITGFDSKEVLYE